MAIAQYASLRQTLPSPTIAVTSGGFLTGSGALYFTLQGRNRAGLNLPSTLQSVTYSAGQRIQVTIPSTARNDGEDIHWYVISASTTNDPTQIRQLAIYNGYEADQITPTVLPATITFDRDEHLKLSATVDQFDDLPSGTNLKNGMLRGVNELSKILRYDASSTATVDNQTVYPSAIGRWIQYGSFNTYQDNTTNAGGCDRPLQSVPTAAVIQPPPYPADGSLGTPIKFWLLNERSELYAPVTQGTRFNLKVFQDGLDKSQLFSGLLKMQLDGFVRYSTGVLDTADITTGNQRDYFYGKAGSEALEKDLPSGYGLAIQIRPAFKASQLNQEIIEGAGIRILPFFFSQSGDYNPAGVLTGDVILPDGDRRRILPDTGLGVIALSGSGIVKRFEFPLQGEDFVAGLLSNTAGQKIVINGDGVVSLRAPAEPLAASEALRAIVGTAAGVSSQGMWSGYSAVASGASLAVTCNYPLTIRGDYPDVIAGSDQGAFNPLLVTVYLQRQSTGEIRKFEGLPAVAGTSQNFVIDTWADGEVIASTPIAPDDFGLWEPGASSFVASASSTDFPADSYQVAFAFEYDGAQVTSISHDPLDGCIREINQTIAEYLAGGQSVTDADQLALIPAPIDPYRRVYVKEWGYDAIYDPSSKDAIGVGNGVVLPSNQDPGSDGRWLIYRRYS